MAQKKLIKEHTRNLGMVWVVVGLVTFALARWIDGGFFGGMFDGMTIALMIGGAYFLARGVFGNGLTLGGRKGESEEELWLPSHDEK